MFRDDENDDSVVTREETPLLKAPDENTWVPQPTFTWAELATFAKVLLSSPQPHTYSAIGSDLMLRIPLANLHCASCVGETRS